MSAGLSVEDIVKFSKEFDYAYSDYQIESYIVNNGVIDWRKAKQCLIEIEQRTQALEDWAFTVKKDDAKIAIKKEELEKETSPGKQQLLEIELEELEEFQNRNKRRMAGIERERSRFIEIFRKFADNQDDLKKLQDSSVEEEKKYWIARMAKQSAMDMLSYGKIGTGNMESIMQMPHHDQAQIIHGALQYTKRMETAILSIEKEVEHNLLESMKDMTEEDIIPKLTSTVAPNAKLLNSPKS